jgi:hypothetical protein
MIGDLHVHTNRSDGSYSPKEAVLMAKERGLDYIGIVDHDTAEGLEEAAALGLRLGVLVVPGIEISAYDYKRGRKAHILGYRYSSPAVNIKKLCDPMLKARDAMTKKHIAAMAAAGYPVTIEEVVEAARGARVLYKQHIMAVLVRKGIAERIYGPPYGELFHKGGLCSEEIAYADAFDALRAIHEDGGVAVLAHPGQLDSWELLDELLAAGLDGVELYHESHSLVDHGKILVLAKIWPALALTGGSDDHGSLGSINAMGDIRAPLGAFEALGGQPILPYRFAQGLVREAGAMLRAAMALSIGVELKDGDRRDLVTRYDSEIQEFLISGISARLPGHSFLAEELARKGDSRQGDQVEIIGSGPTWIIDPIDGTTNFARSGRDFAISVALYEGGMPRLGLVYDVMSDEMYAAAPGAGAYLDGARLGPAGRAASIGEALVDMSMDSVRVLRGIAGADPEALAFAGSGHRALGCASLNICRIARGSLDIYLSAKLCPWDYAAADIVLSEAGGASTIRFLLGEEGGARARRFYAAAGGAEMLADAMDILFGPGEGAH